MEILTGIFLVLLLAGEIGLFLYIKQTSSKIDKALGGAKSKSIMKMLAHIMERSEVIEKDFKRLFKEDDANKAYLKETISKVGIVRFNPFGNIGGEQSFSVALLNENEDGALLTYLYSNEGGKMYIKQITNGESKHKLSEEELKALKEANK